MKGTLRPGRKAGVLALAVLLLTCVLMAGAVSAVENNYYKAPDCGWNATHNITAKIPSTSNTWVNFTDLISAITYARSHVSADDQAVFYCRPGAVIYGAIPPTSAASHPSVNFSFTIYGNGASVAHSIDHPTYLFDFSIDTYEPILTSDITMNVYNLSNLTFWGGRSTSHTVNINIDGCTYDGIGAIMFRTKNPDGLKSSININIKNTSFSGGSDSLVHTVHSGTVHIDNCTFKDSPAPVNIAYKGVDGSILLNINKCSFTNCGNGTTNDMKLYSAPVRVVNNIDDDPASVSVKITESSFDNPKSSNGDILLGDGRAGRTSKVISARITNLGTNAQLQVQNPDDSTSYSYALLASTDYEVKHSGSGNPDIVVIPQPDPEPSQPSYISSDGNMENAYRVLFNDGSTTLSVVTDLSSGDKLTKPETPVKDGYTFAGWYKDSACTQAWDFETGIPGDMTLYAKWTAAGSSGETEATATPTKTQTAVTTPQPTKTQTAAATTSAPEATTAIAVSPTLTQAPAPAAGALFGLLAAGLLLRRRN